MTRPRGDLAERIRRHVTIDASTGCWNWTATVFKRGYPQMSYAEGNHRTRRRLVHRVSFEVFKGPIPDGLQVDHMCRNKRCVNPDHLDAVTPRENTLRDRKHRADRLARLESFAAWVVAMEQPGVTPPPLAEIVARAHIALTEVTVVREDGSSRIEVAA